MNFIKEIYDKNKELDNLFDKKYNIKNIDVINKNKLELFVELGELANASKCFKYWSKSSCDYNDMLYEYVDGLMMILTFFNIYNIELEIEEIINEKDSVATILNLYDMYNRFINHNELILKDILEEYLTLSKLLDISNEDILRASFDKIENTKSIMED